MTGEKANTSNTVIAISQAIIQTSKAYLEVDEALTLIKASSNLRDHLLIMLLFHLGCRISEALALQTKDIDFDKGTVTIQHLKSRINLSCPKCNARLGKSHSFCPKCGVEVKEAVAKELEHRKIRNSTSG